MREQTRGSGVTLESECTPALVSACCRFPQAEQRQEDHRIDLVSRFHSFGAVSDCEVALMDGFLTVRSFTKHLNNAQVRDGINCVCDNLWILLHVSQSSCLSMRPQRSMYWSTNLVAAHLPIGGDRAAEHASRLVELLWERVRCYC